MRKLTYGVVSFFIILFISLAILAHYNIPNEFAFSMLISLVVSYKIFGTPIEKKPISNREHRWAKRTGVKMGRR